VFKCGEQGLAFEKKIGETAMVELEGERDEEERGDIDVLRWVEFQESSDGGGVRALDVSEVLDS
jgi:hypothetical protein